MALRHRPKLDVSNITWNTERHKDTISYWRKRLEKIDKDPDRKKRLADCLCAICYYEKSRIGAAVCTQVQCAYCDAMLSSGNSAVDVLCKECASKTGLCRCCGADVELKNRRKRELPTPTPEIKQ